MCGREYIQVFLTLPGAPCRAVNPVFPSAAGAPFTAREKKLREIATGALCSAVNPA
jgi:hypothetical protein